MANINAAAGNTGGETYDIYFSVALFYAGYVSFFSLERRFFKYLAAKAIAVPKNKPIIIPDTKGKLLKPSFIHSNNDIKNPKNMPAMIPIFKYDFGSTTLFILISFK